MKIFRWKIWTTNKIRSR